MRKQDHKNLHSVSGVNAVCEKTVALYNAKDLACIEAAGHCPYDIEGVDTYDWRAVRDSAEFPFRRTSAFPFLSHNAWETKDEPLQRYLERVDPLQDQSELMLSAHGCMEVGPENITAALKMDHFHHLSFHWSVDGYRDPDVLDVIKTSNIPKIGIWVTGGISRHTLENRLQWNPFVTHSMTTSNRRVTVHGCVPHQYIAVHPIDSTNIILEFSTNTMDTLLLDIVDPYSRPRQLLAMNILDSDQPNSLDHLRRMIILHTGGLCKNMNDLVVPTQSSLANLRQKDVWVHIGKKLGKCDRQTMRDVSMEKTGMCEVIANHWYRRHQNDSSSSWYQDTHWIPLDGKYAQIWHSPPGSDTFYQTDDCSAILDELRGYPNMETYDHYWNDGCVVPDFVTAEEMANMYS